MQVSRNRVIVDILATGRRLANVTQFSVRCAKCDDLAHAGGNKGHGNGLRRNESTYHHEGAGADCTLESGGACYGQQKPRREVRHALRLPCLNRVLHNPIAYADH